MEAKLVMHHDDPPCEARLDSNYCCPECGFPPDMRCMALYFYCPTCDMKLKDMKCPICKQTFEPTY